MQHIENVQMFCQTQRWWRPLKSGGGHRTYVTRAQARWCTKAKWSPAESMEAA